MILKLDFDNPKNQEKYLGDFKTLLNSPGWTLFVSIAQANMDVIREQIIRGIGEETLESVNRLRDRLKIYEDLISTPEQMIEKLTPSEKVENNEDDPYELPD